MPKNFLFEPFTDGVEINEVDFMQRRQIFYPGTEFCESLKGKRCGPRNCNVNVGVGVSRTFGP